MCLDDMFCCNLRNVDLKFWMFCWLNVKLFFKFFILFWIWSIIDLFCFVIVLMLDILFLIFLILFVKCICLLFNMVMFWVWFCIVSIDLLKLDLKLMRFWLMYVSCIFIVDICVWDDLEDFMIDWFKNCWMFFIVDDKLFKLVFKECCIVLVLVSWRFVWLWFKYSLFIFERYNDIFVLFLLSFDLNNCINVFKEFMLILVFDIFVFKIWNLVLNMSCNLFFCWVRLWVIFCLREIIFCLSFIGLDCIEIDIDDILFCKMLIFFLIFLNWLVFNELYVVIWFEMFFICCFVKLYCF